MNKRGRKGVGLSSGQRTKLRRLIASGKLKLERKWGDSWELTDEVRVALGIQSAIEVAQNNGQGTRGKAVSNGDKPKRSKRASSWIDSAIQSDKKSVDGRRKLPVDRVEQNVD